ncbi:hypothetical protein [Paenibacillus sp. FJAT-27812]|uniref:hypothetical protein n=1 Tax=Paenibacillus sp. FJAT-27812 TaxID=1684143 RepID=UPI0006A77D6B|nr:hypothetical protein [Paenibacillus sp. FJAT-27812]
MKFTNQISALQIEVKGLKKNYAAKKERTFKLGSAAIDSLLKEKIKPTFRKIAERATAIDEEKRGFHPNTVKTNEDLYRYYLEKCNSRGKKVKTQKIKIIEKDFNHLKLDRDIERVKRRYLQLSKIELVTLLLNAEQFIAEQNQTWLKNQFNAFK